VVKRQAAKKRPQIKTKDSLVTPGPELVRYTVRERWVFTKEFGDIGAVVLPIHAARV